MNAIAQEITEYIATDPTIQITPDLVNQAKEILIKRQDTHLDSLAERLREDRVRAIIQPILSGLEIADTPEDDRRYLLDLGLVVRSQEGGLKIANPIYQDVIPRVLSQGAQDSLPMIQPSWLNPDGNINPQVLLEAFLKF